MLAVRGKKIALDQGEDLFLEALDPLIISISNKWPLYLREDLQQELRMDITGKFESFYKEFLTGKISSNLLGYIYKNLYNYSISWVKEQTKIDCKFVRIDDINIEPVIFPKSYKKSKLIMKVRKALETFYRNRYPNLMDGKRASRFAYSILKGKRPNLQTNNLQKFFGGNRLLAQQAYTTSLVIIRTVLEQNAEEVECILEG